MNDQKHGISGFAASLAAFLIAVGAIFTFWGTYGWITKTAYALDEQEEVVVHQGQASQESIDNLTRLVGEAMTQGDLHHTEWKCDEASEEIVDLQMDIEDEQDRRKKYELQVDMTTQVNNMAKWDCGQFKDNP